MADARKKQVRNAHRSNVKRLEGNINNEIQANSDDRVKLNGFKISLESKIKTIQQLDAEILGELTDDDAISKEVEDASLQEEYMYGLISKLDSVLHVDKSPKLKAKRESSKVRRASSSDEESDEDTKVRVKLPEYKIPHFYGDPVEWRAFWDQYKASIHDNKKLGTIHKYNYLRSYLHDAAKDCINGLTLTEGNYKTAVEILTERFGNTQVLIRAYTDALAQLPVVHDVEDVSTLRVMYDKIQVCVRNLSDLGVATDSYGSLLISIVFDRMPEELRLYISRQFKDDEWALDQLLKMFKEELTARERCKAVTSSSRSNPTSGQTLFVGGGSQDRRNRGNVMNGGRSSNDQRSHNNENNRNSQRFTCFFCGGDHKNETCTNVPDIASRKEIIMKKRRCFVCLQQSHVARNCRKKYKCRHCEG